MSFPDGYLAGLLDAQAQINHAGIGKLSIKVRSTRSTPLLELKRRWGGRVRGTTWEARSAEGQLGFLRYWAENTGIPAIRNDCELFISYLEKRQP